MKNSAAPNVADQHVTASKTAAEAPRHGATRHEPTDFPLAIYSGHRPEQVLAAWGLTSLLPGARIRFEGPWATPIISWAGTTEQLAQAAARGLVEFTASLRQGAMATITTTTPTRSLFDAVSTDAWDYVRTHDAGLPTRGRAITNLFDVSPAPGGTLTGPKDEPTNLKVRSSALTLYSGRSYAVNSLEDTWLLLLPAGTRMKTDMPTELMVKTAQYAISALLEGELHIAIAKPALRFSVYDPSPRTTTGYESTNVIPLTDLLACCGQLLLQPRQYFAAPTSIGKAFSWVINDEPLTIEQIIDLHETPPTGLPWPRWESPIAGTGSEAKFSILHQAHRVPSENEGRHA